MDLFVKAVNYFHKKLHLRCLTGFWIRLCEQTDIIKFPGKHEIWSLEASTNWDFSKNFYNLHQKLQHSKTTSLQFLTRSHGFKVEPGLIKTSDFSEYIFWSSWSTKQVNEIIISMIFFGQGLSLSNFSPFNTCCKQKEHTYLNKSAV